MKCEYFNVSCFRRVVSFTLVFGQLLFIHLTRDVSPAAGSCASAIDSTETRVENESRSAPVPIHKTCSDGHPIIGHEVSPTPKSICPAAEAERHVPRSGCLRPQETAEMDFTGCLKIMRGKKKEKSSGFRKPEKPDPLNGETREAGRKSSSSAPYINSN